MSLYEILLLDLYSRYQSTHRNVHMKMMFALGLSYMAFIMLRQISYSMANFCKVFFVCLFFNPKWVWVFSKAFAASIEMTMWFLLFNFFMWCFTLTDSWILKNSCIPGVNPIWSWCMTLLMGWGFRLLAFCWGFCVYVC